MPRQIQALALTLIMVAPAPVAVQIELGPPVGQEERALEQFNRGLDRFIEIHRRIERSLPSERLFDDADEMLAVRKALRNGIVAARPHAREGDVFLPVADVIRHRLLRVIRSRGYDPAAILSDNRADRVPRAPMPRVNKPFGWGLGAAMWPMLLRALPELSDELQYRFVDRDLVLIDMRANLVVDILRDALPPADS